MAKTAKARKIFFEKFKTLNHLLETMDERTENIVFRERANDASLSSQKEEKEGRKSFSGVKNYTEAMDMMKTGFKDPLEKMKRGVLQVGQQDNHKRPKLENDFVGFIPHVPNTLMNLPMTMINKQRTPQKAKTIHLTYSFCAPSIVTTSELIKGGINFISLVNSLEKQGYRVKIDIFFLTLETKSGAGFVVNVKEYGQHLNLLKLTFPLVHPAMLRRIAFRYLETAPELKEKDFEYGYGKPLGVVVGNGDPERKFLKDHGILTEENSYYCNVVEASEVDSVESLAKIMNIVK